MKKSEILELCRLKDWTKNRLATELHVTENTIYKWLAAGKAPEGANSDLMRIWLRMARGEIRIVEVEPAAVAG